MFHSGYLCMLEAKVGILTRYFLSLSYVGKNYHGWQWQPNAVTVQEILEKAISAMLGEKTGITGAGRTDTGVHAREMFAHFDSPAPLNPDDFTRRLNAFLPKDIAVHHLREVQSDAHARFDATARTYEYWLNSVKNPFLTDYSYYFYRALHVEKMNEAALLLAEYRDFECFSKTNTEVKTYICKITKVDWQRQNDILVFTITADRFLRNMVRAIVGTLLEVGLLKTSIQDFRSIIESKKRSQAGASVPAHGLYLTKITYPPHIFTSDE